ncbi:GAF domain-containing protein [Gloeocapsopsis sp. IPPAS B-1203]|uniref:GAF domain-containing protein n=1 Tax=Gloeocapsopsis sp. IPPAS B-1203 TaxID=2049454 RepID=UPI000C1779D1|nr:GAF domain-containing protein [Gloeocapsopsis sp. IPPAS B-1203]PIG94382.1 adenylate cyclase [Gloeocapsopsis sp. IPPAS B-1203]
MEPVKNNKPKVLILDDQSEFEILCCALKQDYEVLVAHSQSAVLELLTTDVAVLISCEISLSQAALSATNSDILQLILTDKANSPELSEAVSTGKIFKCLPKSCSLEVLKTAIDQAVETYNVLKLRTQKLYSTLHRQARLNTITNTIRSALNSRQILQTIVDTVGQILDVSCCILRPFQDNRVVEESFIYQKANRASDVIHDWVLVQTVWEARELQIINDVTTDVRLQNAIAYQQANISSSLIVPLCQQELMAVMAIHQCDRLRQWQDDEIELVTLVADQAALALSQARAYDRISALAQREALINKITAAIRSSLDPQDIFAAITQQLGQALHVDGCALSLWTEEDEFVQCVGLYNRTETESFLSPQQLPQSRSPIAGNPVLQLLLKTQQPVVINDLNQQPEMRGLDLPLSSPAARALLVVPLLADNTSIGSITLRSFYKPRHWQIEEIELAQAVAAQAAIAVQQSRLYQKSCALADRLMELDRQKTHFFQNISHEFRTPLTLMLAPLESAVNQQQDLPLEQAAIALRNSRRLLRLVNQLLDLQRLDAGRMQPSFRPCDLLAFVSQIVESFRPYCEKKELELITEFNLCPLVYLDTEKFDKVIYNLLSNAMKFTPPGGKITIRVETAGDHCLIQVKDTGIGIAKEQIPHLFKRFHQAEAALNRSYEGSGLGLALAKELIELHSGQISVESIREQGTTFTVWLPIGKGHLPLDQILEVPTQVQLRSAAVELADLEVREADPDNDDRELAEDRILIPNLLVTSHQPQITILVVDDNLDLRTYVSTILTQQGGYQVYTARNGIEGLHLADSILPDLIVTDLMMPQLSGLEMIWQIRNDRKLKGIPIVLLTAKTDEETRITGTEHGADAYLAKPFNDRELLAEVRNLLALKENERRVVELNTYLTESVLKRFLPPEMVKKAAMGDLALDLRPEPHLITILFSDIVGFTQLANTLRSRRVAELLNEYLETMIRAVFDNGGTVDKFMGDALLAIFGAPEDMMPNEQVRRAIATARAMHHALTQLNQRWHDQGILGKNQSHLIQFRCGIHQGTAVVGMFGSAERADYTAIGPSVNIAARLQQAAAPGQILVSAAVADYLDDDEIIKYSPLELKGVDETVLTFSVCPNQAGD